MLCFVVSLFSMALHGTSNESRLDLTGCPLKRTSFKHSPLLCCVPTRVEWVGSNVMLPVKERKTVARRERVWLSPGQGVVFVFSVWPVM